MMILMTGASAIMHSGHILQQSELHRLHLLHQRTELDDDILHIYVVESAGGVQTACNLIQVVSIPAEQTVHSTDFIGVNRLDESFGGHSANEIFPIIRADLCHLVTDHSQFLFMQPDFDLNVSCFAQCSKALLVDFFGFGFSVMDDMGEEAAFAFSIWVFIGSAFSFPTTARA